MLLSKPSMEYFKKLERPHLPLSTSYVKLGFEMVLTFCWHLQSYDSNTYLQDYIGLGDER